jgi:hypothetical protein
MLRITPGEAILWILTVRHQPEKTPSTVRADILKALATGSRSLCLACSDILDNSLNIPSPRKGPFRYEFRTMKSSR